MTETEVVGAFLSVVAAQPDIGAEFVRSRDLWQQAEASQSKELAEASGEAFAHLVDRYGEARGEPVDQAERHVLRDLLRSKITPAEGSGVYGL